MYTCVYLGSRSKLELTKHLTNAILGIWSENTFRFVYIHIWIDIHMNVLREIILGCESQMDVNYRKFCN